MLVSNAAATTAEGSFTPRASEAIVALCQLGILVASLQSTTCFHSRPDAWPVHRPMFLVGS